MLVFLEQKNAGTLGQHGAVALLGERPETVGAQHAHCLPGARRAPVQRGLRRAGDAEIDETFADHAVGETDGVRRRGAGAHDAEGRPLDGMLDADMRRGRRADRFQQGQRMGRALVLLEQHLVGELESGQSADAGADDAGGTIGRGILERDLEFRHGDGFLRRAAGILRVLVGEHQRLALQPLFRIEVWDFARDGDVKVLGGEALHLTDAAGAALERRPKLLNTGSQRSHDALAGHHDASSPVTVCHVVLSRNSKPGRRPGKAPERNWLVQAAAPGAFVSLMMLFTRSTTDPTVANASTSSLALYGISIPKVSSISKTITAK